MKRCVVSNRWSSYKLVAVLHQLLCNISLSISNIVDMIVTICAIKRRRSSIRVTGEILPGNLWRKIVLIPTRWFGYINRLFRDKVALRSSALTRWYEIGVEIVRRFVDEKCVVVESPSCH